MGYKIDEQGTTLYDKESLEILKESGWIASTILKELIKDVQDGNTTENLERTAEDLMTYYNVSSAFKGHEGYPFSTCLSVNEFIVHGFPTNAPLKNGDKISVDLGVIHRGHYSDNCRTLIVGGQSVSPHNEIIELSKLCFDKALEVALPGNTIGDIGFTINSQVLQPKYEQKYKVVGQFTGHSIGRELHMPPAIPNMGFPGKGMILKVGMSLCIEPVLMYKSSELNIFNSKEYPSILQFKTTNNLPGSHYENQIFITESGPVIVTHSD